ncbi:MAG: Na+/H+ antiporter NhaC family protein, partial [Lachnospiraceae bacterium]|nr:Na+/H+ antiporter NhaC family protein [Lachnospiraceae bacterium]
MESITALYGTFWALLPPIIAFALALLTKEFYSSLFVGILVVGFLFSGGSFVGAMNHIFLEDIVLVPGEPPLQFGMINVIADTYNVGILIFIDDYFNCLTVGSVMRPVTDRHNVSRAKLAYLIDATAAPVCIIAPISSWAAAVSGFAPEGTNGLLLFIKAIPYNYYAILTFVMIISVVLLKIDYGPMARHEMNAIKNNDLFTVPSPGYEEEKGGEKNGKVIDLVLPIVCLVICCVIGMIYTGGFFDGESFIDAFANCDASNGLVLGSFMGLAITLIWYIVRGTMKFKDCMECLTEGFKAMVPAIMILVLAWTLKNMTDSLGAAEYVAGVVEQSAGAFKNLLPAIIFVIACFLSFATGTSWGT